MQIQKFHRLMNAQGDEGGEGGGGQSQPNIEELIAKAVAEQTAGLKAKNSELLGKLKEQSSKLQEYDGIDPQAVKTILQRFSDDEEAKLIAGGKIDEVLNKRTERMKAEYEKQVAERDRLAQEAVQRAKRFEERVLDNAIREAAVKAGLHPNAIDDALFRGRTTFALDENGNAIAFDGDGNPIMGKDGKTPFTPAEWLEGMKEKAPHWFPATATGSGAGPSFGGQSNRGSFGGSKEERLAAIKQLTKGIK